MIDFNININCSNAAFDDAPEIELARILSHLVNELREGIRPTVLIDLNGNTVGTVTYE